MSNVDWDSKVVIGQKAKAAKVTRNTSDLNGTPRTYTYVLFLYTTVADQPHLVALQLYVHPSPGCNAQWILTDAGTRVGP